MMQLDPTFTETYERAHEGVLLLPHEGAGILQLDGPDRQAFLHRLSTNDIESLPVGTHGDTLLTNALGRMVDRLTVLSLPEYTILITSDGQAEAVRDWLARYILYGDEVEIADVSSDWTLWGTYGPQGEGKLDENLPEWRPPSAGELEIRAESVSWRTQRPEAGFRLLLRGSAREAAHERWGSLGSFPSEAQAYEALRVEAGIPKIGAEITDEVTPLEIGLEALIDFTKGCYLGQEVIARMESRGRRPRILKGIGLSGPAQAGAEVSLDGKKLGTLTSFVHSPRHGPIGLALLATRSLPPAETSLELGDGLVARLRPLPFDR